MPSTTNISATPLIAQVDGDLGLTEIDALRVEAYRQTALSERHCAKAYRATAAVDALEGNEDRRRIYEEFAANADASSADYDRFAANILARAKGASV